MLKETSITVILIPRNLADQVYDILDKAILNGEFLPGEEMPEAAIAEKLGVSATPVREAINRLAADGLVVKEANKRPRVIILSEKEIHDLYDVRLALETLGISTAALSITAQDIQELRALQRQGEEYFSAGQVVLYRQYDREFHDKILSISGNMLLMEFMERIKKRVTLCASSTVRIPKMREHAVRQHHDMIDLLDQRDAQGAEDLMKIHIQSAKQAFLRHYQQGQKSRKTDD